MGCRRNVSSTYYYFFSSTLLTSIQYSTVPAPHPSFHVFIFIFKLRSLPFHSIFFFGLDGPSTGKHVYLSMILRSTPALDDTFLVAPINPLKPTFRPLTSLFFFQEFFVLFEKAVRQVRYPFDPKPGGWYLYIKWRTTTFFSDDHMITSCQKRGGIDGLSIVSGSGLGPRCPAACFWRR
jgi:hypothetical protein